ncbi:type 1 fimbrial protein [Klebsiella sp. RHBSTW-00215]|uniref:fimbrial protein n=1 Tax=Klebsiella sp. RHBSTW-00215 TaxID=2742640 RepID=UPI0015F77B8C|nr:fimbrial protein [Klebsiella sp. RHBSTW-00215]MBA7931783.1 type 1 fimbrial protein [Klebsiella sp. RHBSTW-00215]
MKRLLLSTVVASCLVATGAQAVDGTINFQGELVDSTCNISIDGGPSNLSTAMGTITLPTVSSQSLSLQGSVIGRTQFNIELSGCSGLATTTTAAAYFENGSTVSNTTNNLVNMESGGATNVQRLC